MKSYSQYGQDIYLYENFFKDSQKGFFLDIGAHDGITGNNTFLFEELGWSGICIEPIPEVFEKLKVNRKCDLINCAVSDNKSTVDFLVLKGYTEMLSGILKNYDERHLSRINSEIKTMGGEKNIIKCETITIQDLKLPKNIDYLSIDVEGSELSILKTFNFDTHNVSIISIENNYNDQNITNILLENNFEIIKNLGCDTIFKNKKFSKQ